MSRYAEYLETGGYCRGCGKRRELCRCEEWNGPAPASEPKDYTFSHYDLGLRKTVYGGPMTRKNAEQWAKALMCAKGRRVAQAGTVKVLRVLPVLRVKCSCAPRYQYDSVPRLSRWKEKGRF